MGARKNKWTAEEEAALRAGILKHGAGKWRLIANDAEFKDVLALRSNVDLKDKWRNLSVMENGSREKARVGLKRLQLTPTTDIDNNPIQLTPAADNDNNPLPLPTVVQSREEIIDVEPLAVSSGTLQITTSKKPISRLDTVILEAITNLKEPSGSNRSSIAMYIEDQYSTPSDFKRVLTAELKILTTSEKLVKVDGKYRIAPCSIITEAEEMSGILLLEGGQRDSSILYRDGVEDTRSQIHADLAKMENMSVEEVAAMAAEAVAAAEAATAEAEQAVSEAQVAEAAAEAAEVSAEKAMLALQILIASRQMVGA